MKVYILHENDEWTAPLLEALDKHGVPCEAWHMAGSSVNLDEVPPPGIYYNRMSASAHSRGHRFAPEFTQAVLAWLDSHGRTVYNGTRSLQLELSKVAQYQALKAHDIPVPETAAAVGEKALIEAVTRFPTPFITKHNRAGKGLGVHKFSSADELQTALQNGTVEEPVDGIMLLQQFIDSPDSSVVRCEFSGGKFMYAVKVRTMGGFELCPAEACSTEEAGTPQFEIISNFSSPLIEKYESFLAANDITFAGIEHISDVQGRTYTYDVNTNTNYNPQAEENAGIHGMEEAARFLKGKLQSTLV